MNNYTNYKTSALGKNFDGEPLTQENINGWIMFKAVIIKKYEIGWMGVSFDLSDEEIIPYGAIRLVQPIMHETVWVDKNPETGVLSFQCANAPIYADVNTVEEVQRKTSAMWKVWYEDVTAMRDDIRFVWTGKKAGCLHSNYKKGEVTGISCNCESCSLRWNQSQQQKNNALNKVFKALGMDINMEDFTD